ncbi:MAG: aminopeptidase [Flavobacteriales bacterium]|nr:aminopeptidase [Flavobacteriales bacterium]
MIKHFILFLILVSSISSQAQFAYTDSPTNAKDSEYKFTKIAHLDATPVQSQGNTGTCWSFSTLSFFESELIRMGNENPEILSKMYVARKAYEAKAEKYLRMNGKLQFSQGGLSHDIPYVIKRYGIVPERIYSGLNEGVVKHNHSEMFAVLKSSILGLMDFSSNSSKPITPAWNNALNGILNAYLGDDIKEFDLDGVQYTPKSYTKHLGLEIDNYVSITSFTHFDENNECILAIPDNWSWGKSYNVNLDNLMKVAEYALKNGYTLAWDADVSEKGFSFSNGLAINPVDVKTISVSGRDNSNYSNGGAEKKSNAFKTPGEEIEVTPELRQQAYEDKSTTDDHLMHIVGQYKDQNGTKYFLVKNSWGTGNYPEGYLYVSESYFKLKTISLYLHKDALPASLSKKLSLK